MDVIFHIGSPKTGTTTLQNSLGASRRQLLRYGVLYPRISETRAPNHAGLYAFLKARDDSTAVLRARSPESYDALKNATLEEIQQQTRKHQPSVVVLSSEAFFRSLSFEDLDKLDSFLNDINASSVRFSIYVRRFSSHFLSKLGQRMKSSHKIPKLKALNLRSVIESYQSKFGYIAIDLHLYERSSLKNGDIVHDFWHKYLDPLGVSLEDLTPVQSNPSLSAESTDLVRQYRLAFLSDKDRVPDAASHQLVKTLQKIDERVRAAKARLRPEVAEYIDYSTKQALWVRDNFGIEFADYDYERMELGSLIKDPPPCRSLSDLIDVDAEKQRDIIAELMKSRWALSRPQRLKWLSALVRDRRMLTLPSRIYARLGDSLPG